MIRIFILNENNNKFCVNVDNDQDAENLIQNGAQELSAYKIEQIFGANAKYVSPETTVIDELGNITFTPPDFTKTYTQSIENQANTKMLDYDNALRELSLQKRCAETQEEIDLIDGKLADWDAFAIQLKSLKDKPGFPWDGGGPETPWPEMPAI